MSAFFESAGKARRSGFIRVSALLAALLLAAPAAAASIDAGQALYVANCLGCHGMPPNDMKINNLVAANRPELIRAQTQTNPAMQFLASLSDGDLLDVATFLANPVSTDSDCTFSWAEVMLPTLFAPRTLTEQAYGYAYRYYAATGIYLGSRLTPTDARRHVYYLDSRAAADIIDLGLIDPYLDQALAAGCP